MERLYITQAKQKVASRTQTETAVIASTSQMDTAVTSESPMETETKVCSAPGPKTHPCTQSNGNREDPVLYRREGWNNYLTSLSPLQPAQGRKSKVSSSKEASKYMDVVNYPDKQKPLAFNKLKSVVSSMTAGKYRHGLTNQSALSTLSCYADFRNG